jgi:hypothetical protein
VIPFLCCCEGRQTGLGKPIFLDGVVKHNLRQKGDAVGLAGAPANRGKIFLFRKLYRGLAGASGQMILEFSANICYGKKERSHEAKKDWKSSAVNCNLSSSE